MEEEFVSFYLEELTCLKFCKQVQPGKRFHKQDSVHKLRILETLD